MPIVEELIEDMRRHLKVEIIPVDLWDEQLELGGGSPFRTLHTGNRFLIAESELKSRDVVAHEWGHMIAWLDAGKPGNVDFGCETFSDLSEMLECMACAIEVAMRIRWGLDPKTAEMVILYEYSYENVNEFELEWLGEDSVDGLAKKMIEWGESRIKKWEVSR